MSNKEEVVLSDRQSLQALLSLFFKPYWKQIFSLCAISFMSAALNSLYPLLLAPAMDLGSTISSHPAERLGELTLNNLGVTISSRINNFLGIEHGMLQTMVVIVFLFAIAGICAFCLEYICHMFSASISTRAHRDLEVSLSKNLLQQDLGFFLKNRTGELSTRFISDAAETMTCLDFAVRFGLQSLLQIFIYGALLLKTAPSLAFGVVIASLIHLVINRVIGSRLRKTLSSTMDVISETGSSLQEMFMGIRIIKSFGSENYIQGNFRSIVNKVQKATMRHVYYKHGETPLRKCTDIIVLALILLLAFSQYQRGEITFQGFAMFIVVVRLAIAPISYFAQAMTRLQGSLGAANKVLVLLHRTPQFPDGDESIDHFNESITLNDVSFSYDSENLVLNNIDLKVNKGELVAIVGASGAGKTTLIDIILRLYDPNSGEVCIDGRDIKSLIQVDYRSLFGVVSQECLLFHDTIRNNIIFGRDSGNPEDLFRASDVANATEFIKGMPEGFSTIVGDRGVRLSGGQRQRIAIARAIYSKPPILILDEATSALDSESELLVQEAIDRVLEHSTAIVIAHRLSTILHADKIVVLGDGRIEAIGKHSQLLESSLTYQKLYSRQFNNHPEC